MSAVLFWFALTSIVYTYVLFPLLVYARGQLFPRPIQAAAHEPLVSMIIAAYNEQDSIAKKLANIQELDYPANRLEVIVASDGSTDRTNEIVGSMASNSVRLLPLPRRGKAVALNMAVSQATGDVLVFSDANSMYDRGSIRALVAPLADPSVGGVAGDQRYEKRAAQSVTDQGERGFWNYDRFLKHWESIGGNVISATGAIYAIRRSLFQTVPEGVTDDFTTSTTVIAQGYRLVFASDAIAREPVAGRASHEFGRKVRVITRGFRALIARRALFNPFRSGFYAVQIFSHKLMRRLMVFPLLILLISSLLLVGVHPFYALAATSQVAWYTLAFLGLVLSGVPIGRSKLFSWPAYFVMVNGACLCALWKLIAAPRVVLWEPAPRQVASELGVLPTAVGEQRGT